ncbi:phospholipase D-like domain-containing protein [Sulfurifustis variabilis]
MAGATQKRCLFNRYPARRAGLDRACTGGGRGAQVRRPLRHRQMVVDGAWSTIGTANMDYRSFFTNYEVNLVARDAPLAAALERRFRADLAEAAPVVPREWLARGWPKRLSEATGWLVRRWL